MIDIKKIDSSEPYLLFIDFYNKALEAQQKVVEAIAISSYNKISNEVESRHVNLKYIAGEEWVFFTNYNSPKAKQFKMHDQITALFFWNSINIQIRIKAKINKSNKALSDEHYFARSDEKNALAHSSNQSSIIESYEKVVANYEKTLNEKSILKFRPNYWGGFSFKPYYFEFWEGNTYRLNKRETYTKTKNCWKKNFLQP